jgi:hypothetical protein
MHWAAGLAVLGLLVGAQLELDCGRPAASRELIGRARLSDIEWAEDVNREAMWEAFGRCAGPRAEACREIARRRFADDLARERALIEKKYRQVLEDFESRCQASIT